MVHLRKPAAVIFDMDGVIIDSEKTYQDIEREMYTELGIPVTKEIHRQFIGTAEHSMWQEMKKRFGFREDPDELARRERERFLMRLQSPEGIPPMDGIKDLVQKLHGLGVLLMLASSSSKEIIQSVLIRLNLESYFSVIVSGDDVERSKPAPDIFLKASRIAGIQPSSCVVIEDSENGIKAAKSAGMEVVALHNPNSGDLDLSGADRIIQHLREFTRGIPT